MSQRGRTPGWPNDVSERGGILKLGDSDGDVASDYNLFNSIKNPNSHPSESAWKRPAHTHVLTRSVGETIDFNGSTSQKLPPPCSPIISLPLVVQKY